MDQETKEFIKKKLSLVPELPGSYQMKDKDGVIIYVGKAKTYIVVSVLILRERLRVRRRCWWQISKISIISSHLLN